MENIKSNTMILGKLVIKFHIARDNFTNHPRLKACEGTFYKQKTKFPEIPKFPKFHWKIRLKNGSNLHT